MSSKGVLEVHDNVVFEANSAAYSGGAVSLPLEIGVHLTIALFCDRFCEGRFDSLRQLTKPRRKS